ncbi:putative aldo keto reductase [Lyophyllum shimeji]|uniref:Aldo keto reductase n=1 Tax=Lyophyllum shimeji TaxID=47721 RepID=A0A9P3UHX5_LYOSH|nr:putative aldo keto reductase [Lyophyllum shimeji]
MASVADDQPSPGASVATIRAPSSPVGRSLQLPAIVFGAATFSAFYNPDEHVKSAVPERTVGLALRYGIRAFDTSIYYGPSEIVLGNALQALKSEFPRSSYKLMTKCGRYGTSDFDYSPARIRASVKNSLERLQTDYLDVVYLHDVEFVCTPVAPRSTGCNLSALADESAAYGLAEGDEGKIRGEGDQKVLDAFGELRKLQEEGLVKHIGISGYPLPTLLRMALLVLHTPPYRPVDVILSYSHLSLQNSTFLQYAGQFRERAQVGQLLTASPLSMGLLTPSPPPWHPALTVLSAAVQQALDVWPQGLPNLALGYAIRNTGNAYGDAIPLVTGFSTPQEVHECVRVWREIQDGDDKERKSAEDSVRDIFRNSGYLDWSWASP